MSASPPPAALPSLSQALKRWDIFCAVIDNHGDIGVCWRLARQLANEYGAEVRLWVDDLAAFQPLCPELLVSAETQQLPTACCETAPSIEVRHWAAEFPPVEPGDVVVEAFACRLPDSFERAMAGRASAPLWINLDYLSAEDWITGCHALPSPHPSLPLTKYFFFPGFNERSGGLLRECDLDSGRQAFQASSSEQAAFWRRLGFLPPETGTLTFSLFAYDNLALPALLAAWAEAESPVCLLLPPTRTQATVEAWLGHPLPPGQSVRRGALDIRGIPFVSQADYDRLLWLGSANFVRGEDSFVRAQWAAAPLVWHIYPQEDGAHRVKLEAFLTLYCAGLSLPAEQAVRKLHGVWNGFEAPAHAMAAWQRWQAALPELVTHAAGWQKNLQKQQDLCAALVRFCRSKL